MVEHEIGAPGATGFTYYAPEPTGSSLIHTSNRTTNIVVAMLGIHKDLPAIAKDGKNPDARTGYITLDNMLGVVKPILQARGCFLAQSALQEGALLTVATRITHMSGEWIEGTATVPVTGRFLKGGNRADPDAQSGGSAISYAKRYGLAALLGIAGETDDDGRGASHERERVNSGKTRRQPPPEAQVKPEPTKYVAAEEPWESIMPTGHYKGQMLGAIPSDVLKAAGAWASSHKQKTMAKDIAAVLTARALGEISEPANPMTTKERAAALAAENEQAGGYGG